MGVTRVLITGVSGFLGKSLVSAFHQRENIVLFGHSRRPAETRRLYNGFNIAIVDSINAALLNELRIDTIIHLAGIAHDLTSQYSRDDYFRVNDMGTRLLYDEFLRSDAASFIFLSSIKAAVDASSTPVDESVAAKPISAYGKSKLSAEAYIQEHASTSKTYYILRPCMVHGPGNKGNLNLLYKYVRTRLPFPLGAFENRRSFLSITNFNYIISRLITGDNIPSGIYHLADDGYLSTPGLFRLIASAAGRRSLVLKMPQRVVKLGFRAVMKTKMLDKLTEDMLVSNQKIKNNLRVNLPVSLREGLIHTIESFRER